MKNLFLSLVVFLLVAFAVGTIQAEWVNGYTKSNGTYVDGYNRSDSNDTVRDNYSYKGNANPYTGSEGTNYYRNNSTSEYYGTSGESKKYNPFK